VLSLELWIDIGGLAVVSYWCFAVIRSFINILAGGFEFGVFFIASGTLIQLQGADRTWEIREFRDNIDTQIERMAAIVQRLGKRPADAN